MKTIIITKRVRIIITRKRIITKNGKFGCEIKIPIFMTPAETEHFNKIENKKKKDDIAAEIAKLVSEMPDSEVRDSYLKDSKRWDRIKQKDLVSLYYEVKQSLHLQRALSSIEPADDSELLATVSNDE